MSASVDVRAFHVLFGHPVRDVPALPADDEVGLRYELLREEFFEYAYAAVSGDLVGVADALADMLYIIHGTALAYGIPLDDVFDEVHRSNMSKLGDDGLPVYRADGKVMKGPSYSPPDVAGVLARASDER